MQLITQNKTDQLLDTANNRGLFVTLPDQQHCYFLSDPPDFQGVMVSTIPFTHPNSVPSIIGHLRQQALFNTLIESCARVNSIQDLEKSVMFEVSCTDLTHIAITFEHPSDESMATVELDLTHVNQIACQVYTSSAVPVCPEDLANKVIQKCMSIPITMRSLIRYGQSKLKPVGQEPDTEMSLANNSFFNGGNAEGQYSHGNGGSAPNSGIDSKYGREGHLGVPGSAQPGHEESMETDRGGGANNSTGFGDYIKDEPMDYEHDSGTFKSGAGSLNEYGPQDATFNPEASSSSQPKSSSSSSTPTTAPTTTTSSALKHKVPSTSSGSSSSNMSLKLKTELGSTAKTESGSGHESMLLPPKMEHIKPEFSLTKASPSSSNDFKGKAERRESSIPDIKPLVSITPVSSSTCSLSMSKKSAGGIEIIPLGGSNEKDKSRELIRRSLSEDDKRRLEKKSMSSKKRKHLSSSRVSTGDGLSSSKKKLLDGKGKGKLDTVINRLQNPGPESSIELFPKGKEPTKVAPKSSSSLKLTIKAPNKFPSPSGKDPKPKSSSSSPSSKEKSSSKHSSSSSKSSSHRSHGSSSSSQGSSSKSSKSTYKDRKRSSHGSSSSSRSSSTDRDRDRHQREREEVKKLLDGGKLNKTFQIPKLSKSSSPSTAKNPTTPQIYWRWECHTAQHQPQTPIFSAIECAAPSHHLAQYDAKGELQAVTSRRPPMEWEASHGTPQCAAHVPDPDKSSGLEGSGNAESLSSMSGPAKTAQGDGGDFVMTVRLVSTGK
ncbi:mediator of RNA polymerase II transcription subunit 1-like [Tigriopus californicus]|uniref:mediator of RNA polymerase II transcription subunit 1-like n=1 Tax=Tigriopus californicus TaxID=6832 RepID=UPI0027DA8966|nr:mediator of RNA polymerase II transcription subunit 1-like [Tigriopus californicus]